MASTNIIPIEPVDLRQIEGDMATKAFLESAIEILAMPEDEFSARIPEFAFAAHAVMTRIARSRQ